MYQINHCSFSSYSLWYQWLYHENGCEVDVTGHWFQLSSSVMTKHSEMFVHQDELQYRCLSPTTVCSQELQLQE